MYTDRTTTDIPSTAEPVEIRELDLIAAAISRNGADLKKLQAELDAAYLRQRLAPELEVSEADAVHVAKLEYQLRSTERIAITARARGRELAMEIWQKNRVVEDSIIAAYAANTEAARAAAEAQLADFFPADRLAVVIRYASVVGLEFGWQLARPIPATSPGLTLVSDGKGGVMLEAYDAAAVVSYARQLRALAVETAAHTAEVSRFTVEE